MKISLPDGSEKEAKEFQMSNDDHVELTEICQRPPVMGETVRDRQEEINRKWQEIASSLGFVWHTAEAVEGKDDDCFWAVPVERV